MPLNTKGQNQLLEAAVKVRECIRCSRVEDIPEESHPKGYMSILSKVNPAPNECSSDSDVKSIQYPIILKIEQRQVVCVLVS